MKQSVFDGMEYVYAVYRAGSFQRAAEELFVSQPSVSASVRRVEERVGSRLFDRSRKPLALTECGEAYIACAEKILAMERGFAEYVNDWEGLRCGELVVGAHRQCAADWHLRCADAGGVPGKVSAHHAQAGGGNDREAGRDAAARDGRSRHGLHHPQPGAV